MVKYRRDVACPALCFGRPYSEGTTSPIRVPQKRAGNPSARLKKKVDVDHRAVVPPVRAHRRSGSPALCVAAARHAEHRELTQQLQRIAIGGRLSGRIDINSDKPEVATLVTAVNHLLTRAGSGLRARGAETPKLFAELGDRIHEAVLVHREVILYANRQFASFVGVDRLELIGRRLADLVPPEYAELVGENIAPAAGRGAGRRALRDRHGGPAGRR